MPTKPPARPSAKASPRRTAAKRPSAATSPRAARLAERPAVDPVASADASAEPTPVEPAPGRPHGTMRRGALLAVALTLVLAAMAAPMGAQGGGNSGTIKVHDEAVVDPPQQNDPHVENPFYIEGFNMAATEGTLQFFSWPPTGDMTLVLDTTWESDDGEPANHFLAGPFELPCGHYRVEAQNGMEADDFPGGVKSKMFWVDGCEPAEEPCEPGDEECPIPCGEPGGEPCPEPPMMECPADLAAVANQDGSVTLTWTDAAGSDGTNVYRADGDGDFEYVTTVGSGIGAYVDTTTVAGNAYRYMVTGWYGDAESTGCAIVEVTAIPEFPTVVALGAASAAGLLAFALRRRK